LYSESPEAELKRIEKAAKSTADKVGFSFQSFSRNNSTGCFMMAILLLLAFDPPNQESNNPQHVTQCHNN